MAKGAALYVTFMRYEHALGPVWDDEVGLLEPVVRCEHGNIDPHPWCPDKSHLMGDICDDPDWCPGSPTLAEPERAPNRWDEPPEAAQG